MTRLFRLLVSATITGLWVGPTVVAEVPKDLPKDLPLGFSYGNPGTAIKQPEVKVGLIAGVKSLVPGRAFHVAVTLDHAPDWHSYWRNSGGFSLPTVVTWELPPGFTAGPMVWPVPKRYVSQGFPAFINPDKSLLVTEVTPPTDLPVGEPVKIKAKVEGQVCKDACLVFEESPELLLGVAAEVEMDPAAAKRISEALAGSAKPLAEWTASVRESESGLSLQLRAGAGASRVGGAYFFSSEPDIDGQAEQAVEVKDDGLVLSLRRPEDDTVKMGQRLRGVVFTEGGWVEGLPGLTAWEIDIPIEKVGPPVGSGKMGAAATEPAGKNPATAVIAPAPAPAKPLGLAIVIIAFVGGLILNLMPCVFPVLGLKIMNFVNQAGEDHRKVVWHGWVFTLGVLVSFWALAGVIIGVKAATGQDNLPWGFQMQYPEFTWSMLVVLFIFSLSLAGLFEFGISATGVGGKLTRKSGLGGSFFSGVLATLVATPCAAPFLAQALGAALAMPAWPSLVLFTAIGLGLSFPYLLLSAFPKLVDKLPRPGPWMETFKKLMAFPMFATSAWLLAVLSQLVGPDEFLVVVLALTVIALGIYIYGHWGQPWQSTRVKWSARLACLILVGGSVAAAWPKPAAEVVAVQTESDGKVAWETWSPERVAELRAANRPVFIDFTAAWCLTCKANKLRYVGDARVLELVRQKGVVMLQADFTRKNPVIATALAAYGKRAVPVNVWYAPGAAEPVFLPELFGAGEVIGLFTPLPDAKKP